jgi:hypothetical protein
MTALIRASAVGCWSWLDKRALALPSTNLRKIILFGSAALVYEEPFISFTAAWLFLIWFVPRAYRDRAELLRAKELKLVADARIGGLQRRLAQATKRISGLEHSLEQAQRSAADRCPAPFRRVGLSENVPLHVALAAKKSFQKRLHPDGHPEHRKAEATRRFQECEGIFDEIWRLRGF